jgi:hypothetical protein
MNALVPCHSSTPKSASQEFPPPSAIVYHGIRQPIRSFRRTMSACGAREANTRVVSRAFRWARWLMWSAIMEQARAGVVRPAMHAGLEEGAVDDQLTPAIEEPEQVHLAFGAFGPFERVPRVHLHPWHPPAQGGELVG